MAKNKKPGRVTDEQIAQMGTLGVSAEVTTDVTVAERAGSDDKVAAVQAEGAKPKVATYRPEDRAAIDADEFGLRVEDSYGVGKGYPIPPDLLHDHAQLVGSMSKVYMDSVVHGPDPTAPDFHTLVCATCGKPATKSPIRTARVDRNTGDLVRDKDGNVEYRGQFVNNGPDGLNLPVLYAHLGACLYKPGPYPSAPPTGLRVRRDSRTGKAMKQFYTDRRTGQERWRWAILDAMSFDQANVRSVDVRNSILRKRGEKEAELSANEAEARRQAEALGFKPKVGDVARHNRDGGIDRGSFAPRLERYKTTRKQQRWVDKDAE